MLGRTEEAAMLKYESAVRTNGVDKRLRSLKNCLQTHFSSDPDLEMHANLIKQQIDLLERQRPVDAADAAVPGVQLVGSSVLTTLHYCCVHHYGEPVNHLASPLAIKERHQLTDKQYAWTVLKARASQRAWADIQALFTSKVWFSSGKLRPVVPFENAVEVLESFGAPAEVLSLYISSIDGSEKRIALAKKYGCFKIVVDTYVAQKDRLALQQYRAALQPHDPAHRYAGDALAAATVRWKN
ncbi:spermatogenesis-defective protein 39 homolog [Pollicipes pollicipes]|uniref:spermatogenesis-defective protein 39 homolog n=1 Tax=Pollicipes pollicipes TaxID=41117 RepID=UPI0018852FB2|nr:spermatogenesis-defective protein 39 homolog [Pollicipes pollicipes]